MRKYSDVISGTVLLLFSAVFFYATTKIHVFASLEGLSSKFFPRIVIGVLVLLGAIIFLRGLHEAKNFVEPAGEQQGGKRISVGSLCAMETILAIFIYVLLLEPVGFLLSTVFYLVAQMVILAPPAQTKKNYITFAVIALIASSGIYFLFSMAFHLLLPAGILG